MDTRVVVLMYRRSHSANVLCWHDKIINFVKVALMTWQVDWLVDAAVHVTKSDWLTWFSSVGLLLIQPSQNDPFE